MSFYNVVALYKHWFPPVTIYRRMALVNNINNTPINRRLARKELVFILSVQYYTR